MSKDHDDENPMEQQQPNKQGVRYFQQATKQKTNKQINKKTQNFYFSLDASHDSAGLLDPTLAGSLCLIVDLILERKKNTRQKMCPKPIK